VCAAITSRVQRSAASGVRIFGRLFEQPEGALEIEAAQERLPPAIHILSGGAGGGAPQPDGLGVAVAGHALDLQPDQGALDDG
jgi:hypothetical protein